MHAAVLYRRAVILFAAVLYKRTVIMYALFFLVPLHQGIANVILIMI